MSTTGLGRPSYTQFCRLRRNEINFSLLDLKAPWVGQFWVEGGEAPVPREGVAAAGQHVQVSLSDPGHLQMLLLLTM